MNNDRLPEGYKQTAIGLIPEDWQVKNFSEFCLLQRGFDITESTRRIGNVPVYSSSGLAYFHDEAKVHPPGVVTGRKGILGKVFYIEEPFWAHDTTLWVSDFKGNDAKYVSFFLAYFNLERFDAATSVPTLNRNNLLGITIPVPPLPEQHSIAQALSDVDALINSLDKLIAKKRSIKTATMQQLLTGKKRLPKRINNEELIVNNEELIINNDDGKPVLFGEGKGYKQTEVGLIPEDWLTLKIGDLFGFRNGLNKAKEFFGTGTPIINYMDVFQYSGLHKSDILGKVTVSADEIRAYGVRQGDVFFTRTSETVEEIGIAAVLLEDIADGVFSGFVLRGRPKASDLDLDLLFKKYCFDSEIVRRQITSTSSYTTRALTNGRLLSRVILPCPPSLEEQRSIASVLSDMDTEIAALEVRRAKTQAIKQGMMQELLTGRTRLV